MLIAFVMFMTTFTSSMYAEGKVKDEEIKFAVSFLQDSYGIDEKEAVSLYYDIIKAQKFYHLDNSGTLSFDTKEALAGGVNPDIVKEIKNSFGELAKENESVTVAADGVITASTACYGMQLYNPAQYRLFADTCHTDDLVWQLKLMAGAAAIIGILVAFWSLPAGAAYEVAAILLGLGATYIERVDVGCGIYIYWRGPHTGLHGQPSSCYKG